MPIVDCSLSIPDKVLFAIVFNAGVAVECTYCMWPLVSRTADTSGCRVLEKAFQ